MYENTTRDLSYRTYRSPPCGGGAGGGAFISFYYMLKHFFLLLFSILVLASCGSNDDPVDPVDPFVPTKTKNTLFVFMPYTANNNGGNSLYYSLKGNIEDMEQAIEQEKGLGNSQLIVFISENIKTSHLIYIGYNKNKGKCRRDTLKTYTDYDYTIPEGITSLLTSIKQMAPADNYSMIIGCHGEGWMPKPKSTQTRYFGGTAIPIDISNFNEGIKNAGMKMNFILFDDCYMSGIEVAYQLRESSNYLIASTSEMIAYGIPYHLILKYMLADNPNYEALCEDFTKFYITYKSGIQPMPYGTIAVTDLSQTETMATFMKTVNSTHTFDIDKIDDVQDLDVEHFDPTVYFDFGSYLRVLCGDDATTYTEGTKLLDKLVPYKGTTGMIYSGAGNKSLKLKEYSGLTISDPSQNSSAINTKKQTAWWKATH